MMGKLAVIGSLNMDMVMRLDRMPMAGETLFGQGFALAHGGKGANQAVAAARMGAKTSMVGRIGQDAFGTALRTALRQEGIETDFVLDSAQQPTGVAMILVEQSGENRIILAPGANHALMPQDIAQARAVIQTSQLVLLQLEIPIPTVMAALHCAAQASRRVVLNPAPATNLPDEAWHLVDILVPNETEATHLTGIAVHDPASAASAAQRLLGRGAKHVLITLGAQGVLLASDNEQRHLPARKVTPLDTTAAGDAFIGALAAGLSEGMGLEQAAQFGIHAASICVTRPGAQASLPHRHDVLGS